VARGFCRVTVHSSGGAGNVEYIGRPMPGEERPPVPGREGVVAPERQPSVDRVQESESRVPGTTPEREDDDPVWTWNAPAYVTGDSYGAAKGDPLQILLENLPTPALTPSQIGLGPERNGFDFSLEEKRERGIAHFSVLADLEELKGGPSHFRIVLSVGSEVSNRELKALVNAFLRENFPLAPAFVAIHRDTEHAHAHVHVHTSQLDDTRVDLGQNYFRLDESWMKICSEQLKDKAIYNEHMVLKAETAAWKEQVKQAREEGRDIPPKPDRHGDHRDTELSFRPWDDKWCGRLQAQTRVAETKLRYLLGTKAREEEVTTAREEAERLRGRLDAAERRRAESRSETKSRMPTEVITISEAQELRVYERELERIRTEKEARPERPTPARLDEQRVLQFDQPRAAQTTQLGFSFDSPPDAQVSPQVERTEAGVVPGRRDRGRDRAAEVRGVEVASPSVDEASRSFGRELVAEARLAFTEQRAGESRSRNEQREVKAQIAEATREYAAAREEAERHRSSLHKRGAAEPPCRLEEDEKSYLRFVSKHVPERLRERITTEVSRSHVAPKIEDEPIRREVEEPEFYDDPPRTPESKKSRDSVAAAKVPEEVRQRETGEQQVVPFPPPRPAPEVPIIKALPDDEASRLVVKLELAKSLAAALRVEEADFKSAPQYWVSPAQHVSLAETERRIDDYQNKGRDVKELNEVKERLQSEIAVERDRLPSLLREAERESRSLEERLGREVTAREALGLPPPSGRYTPDDLHELSKYAERARDPQLLGRVFEIERGQALQDVKSTGDRNYVLRLEEKYSAVQLKAEVRAHRSEATFTAAAQRPEEIRLPAKDVADRDTALTLKQLGVHGGFKGLAKRVFETSARRYSREQLEASKDRCVRHLRADSERHSAFREAARQIARECRQLGQQFGYDRAAVPALTSQEINDTRAHAVKQLGGPRDRWLSACTESQRQANERATRLLEKGREAYPTGPAEGQRSALIRSDLESSRARLRDTFLNRIDKRILGTPDRADAAHKRDTKVKTKSVRTRGGR
jgi:hypothetical protein